MVGGEGGGMDSTLHTSNVTSAYRKCMLAFFFFFFLRSELKTVACILYGPYGRLSAVGCACMFGTIHLK